MRESLREYCLWARREDLLAQWDREKNGALTPETVAAGSHRKVWWLCGRGHRWQAMVKSRVTGCDCPVCAHRVVQPGGKRSGQHLSRLNGAMELGAEWRPDTPGCLCGRPAESVVAVR